MGRYRQLGVGLDRNFRNDYNANITDIESDVDKSLADSSVAKTTAEQAISQSQNAETVANEANTTSNDVQQQLNTIVIESGTSDAEVLQARGGEPVLNDRLNKVDELLAEKPSQADVFSNITTPRNITLSANGANRRPFIVFVDDDGYVEYYNVLSPILESKGYVGCPAIVSSWVDSRVECMTSSQIKELQSKGHEILSHTHDHLMFNTLSPDEMEYQCKTSKETLINMGFQVETLIYPGGNDGGSAGIERIKKYYKSGWRSSSGAANEQYRTLSNGFDMYRISIEGNTLTHLKTQVDRCLSEGNLLVFMTHANIQTAEDTQRFRDIVDYVYSLGIDVGTMNEALGIFGNTFDVGSKKYIKVVAGGDVESNAIGAVFKNPSEGYAINENTPIGYFEPEKITYSRISTSDGAVFPDVNGGYLETFVSQLYPNYAYQIWKPFSTSNIYKRTWTGTYISGSWKEWELIKGSKSFVVPATSLLPAETKTVDVDITAIVGNVSTTNTLPYFLTRRGNIADGVPFTHRIEAGILKLTFSNLNASASKSMSANTWDIHIMKG
jgi:hypothetical protein